MPVSSMMKGRKGKKGEGRRGKEKEKKEGKKKEKRRHTRIEPRECPEIAGRVVGGKGRVCIRVRGLGGRWE